jgi:hypothetical protein
VRRIDAPRAGWYPDPGSRTRLRWWDGLDWSDIRRAPPSDAELTTYEGSDEFVSEREAPPIRSQFDGGNSGLTRSDAQEIINEVRNVARSEVNRAAQEFTQRTQAAVRGVQPLITQYTSKVLRWVRLVSTVAVILLVLWLAFQLFAQVSLFQWVGDRIDNLGNNSGSVIAPLANSG